MQATSLRHARAVCSMGQESSSLCPPSARRDRMILTCSCHRRSHADATRLPITPRPPLTHRCHVCGDIDSRRRVHEQDERRGRGSPTRRARSGSTSPHSRMRSTGRAAHAAWESLRVPTRLVYGGAWRRGDARCASRARVAYRRSRASPQPARRNSPLRSQLQRAQRPPGPWDASRGRPSRGPRVLSDTRLPLYLRVVSRLPVEFTVTPHGYGYG